MVDPTIIAIFSLLLRPPVELEGEGEVDGCVGIGGMALEVAVGEDAVGVGVRVEAGEERELGVVVTGGVALLDVLIFDVLGLAVVRFDVALDAAFFPASCDSVHSTGFCPSSSTMLKSLLMNVGAVTLEGLRSDTWKWHVQAFPSSRGTRVEPVAETDWLYAG